MPIGISPLRMFSFQSSRMRSFVFAILICLSDAWPDMRPLSASDCSCDRLVVRPRNPVGRINGGTVVGALGIEGELASVAAFYVKYQKQCPLSMLGTFKIQKSL